MSADNPKKPNASERALQSILSCIFALLSFFASAALHSLSSLITIGPICKESLIEIPKDATGKDSGGLVFR